MNDDLFANLPEVKSPRLLWMEKHGISTFRQANSQGPVFVAMNASKLITTRASNEHDALVEMAIKLNIKLWNQS